MAYFNGKYFVFLLLFAAGWWGIQTHGWPHVLVPGGKGYTCNYIGMHPDHKVNFHQLRGDRCPIFTLVKVVRQR